MNIQHRSDYNINKATYESPQFRKACENAGIEVTKRQASKFRRKFGRAYLHRND